ncbi:MAG: leucine-rich repeat domain-containing protein [Saprospiraceae bacterium]|nr:leucine-rich repeat domain-containing protein [Saprospiraceae bacterium]
MKKQFTIIASIIATIINFVNVQAQEMAYAVVTPYVFAFNPAIAEPVNANPAEALDLTGQGLYELPTEALVSNAEVIKLDSNLLDKISVSAGQWSQCRQLFARHNWLEEFPEGTSSMGSLELMDLTRNHIDALPASVGKLVSLKKLIMDLNFVSTLPAEVAQMKSLKELSLRWNSLKSLPAEVAQMSSLEVLNLTNNSLTTLPDEIGNMKSLKVLRVNYNNIQKLPASLANLAGTLKILDLSNNPMGRQWISEVKAMLPNTQVIF